MRLPLYAVGLAICIGASATPLTLTVPKPAPDATETYHMGAARAPDGSTLTVDRRSLLLNGQPWTPVMGEFHYSRYPANEWRGELRKMKLGGIDIVATYVFWIHHEEIEGQWDWAGNKDLRQFVKDAAAEGLKVIVRCGPWCHGEVRNGGLPDWIVARGKTRSEDPAFLASTTKLYHHIGDQLSGLLWKDGGPVIGIQLDNEYGGPAEYLLALKKIARAEGLDVPLYTRTGWPQLKTPMPFGEIIPLYGVYAEGFWDRELTTMPGKYWAGFQFSTLRIDDNIANEALGRRETKDAGDVACYPYLTCEIGGGMMSSYHRRILVDTRDITSTTLVKLGSGSVSPGYYMYHGGTNPEGQLTTLMEEQATPVTNWNDMPVKNYDFQAPLGQYGQVREQFYALRPLHLFLHNFGDRLAGMSTVLPDARPTGKDDTATLRWAVRSDGRSGFLFVNNYERGRELPAKEGVQFSIKLADNSTLTIPAGTIKIPTGACFIWPFNFDLGQGATLAWATVQPLCATDEGKTRTVYFSAIKNIPAIFEFDGATEPRVSFVGNGSWNTGKSPNWQSSGPIIIYPSQAVALTVRGLNGGLVRIVVLSDTDSPQFGLNTRQTPGPVEISFTQIRPAGPLRKIELGKSQKPVAAAPGDADFANAAVWRVKLSPEALQGDNLLRFHYVGDVARVYIDGKFITDDYYNGEQLEIGLRRHAAALKNGELTIAILPLQRNAPIYLSDSAKPDFKGADSVATLTSVELAQIPQLSVPASP